MGRLAGPCQRNSAPARRWDDGAARAGVHAMSRADSKGSKGRAFSDETEPMGDVAHLPSFAPGPRPCSRPSPYVLTYSAFGARRPRLRLARHGVRPRNRHGDCLPTVGPPPSRRNGGADGEGPPTGATRASASLREIALSRISRADAAPGAPSRRRGGTSRSGRHGGGNRAGTAGVAGGGPRPAPRPRAADRAGLGPRPLRQPGRGRRPARPRRRGRAAAGRGRAWAADPPRALAPSPGRGGGDPRPGAGHLDHPVGPLGLPRLLGDRPGDVRARGGRPAHAGRGHAPEGGPG